MSSADEPDDDAEVFEGTPGPLPPRRPRPFVVHWLVASACVLLSVLFLVLLTNIPLGGAIAFALLVGLLLAPRLARLEAEGLEARRVRWVEEHGPDGPDDPGDGPGIGTA